MINTDRSVSAPSLPPQAAPEADVVVDPGSAPALERRALFESVVTYANDVVLVTEAEPLDADAGGPRVLYVNPAFTRMTGYAPHEIIGRTPRILQSSATDRTELARLRAALQAWEPAEVELLNVRKDGTEFWVQLNITPVADETGHITHWIAIQRDITVRKRRELSLRGILDGTSDLLVVLNEGRITAVSSVCPRVLGFEPDELRGKPFINLVHPTSRAAVQAFVVDAAVHSVGVAPTLRARVGHRDGTWRWLDLVAADLGGRAGADVVISCVDVTDRVRVEEELAATNERFRSAFDDAPIGMAMTSLSGRFLQVNNALCALLGRSVDEMLSLTVLDITHPEDVAHTERQRQALTRGSHDSHRHETRFLHSDDTVVGILHSSSVVRDPQGVPTLLIDHIENITDRQAFEARLQHQALHDTLTGLPNRALFMDRLDRALTTEGPDRVALLFCDVDRFKTINDTFGHHAGDLVLTSIAQRLQSALRATDTVARLGGDELIVLCTAAGPDEAQATAERLRDALREPIAVSGALIPVTISIGIALSVPGQSTAEQLLRASDDAMYAAKGSGRNQYAVHDEVHSENARRRLLVQASLPHAIDRGEFRLHYQPQMDLTTEEQVGNEALLRWDHPELGVLKPGDFIELAEESGLMRELGQWVLGQAITRAAACLASGDGIGVTWINASASELDSEGFAARVEDALARRGVPGHRLGIEITESVVMTNLTRAHRTLNRLRSLGVQLAIDDFGTGYSSLSYIGQFPVDIIKIDSSFVAGLDSPARRRESFAIVTAVISLAHSLGMKVLAEGVETSTQALILHGLGCDQGQGYLYGRPRALTIT